MQHEKAGEFLERDVGNVLAPFKRKYGLERDLEDVVVGLTGK